MLDFIGIRFVGLCCEADTRAADFVDVLSGKNLGKGIITGLWQFPAKTFGEAGGLGVIKPAKDAMANEPTGAQ
jgi:hypothetical protein